MYNDIQLGGNSKLSASKELRVWTLYLMTQLLRLPPEEQDPKTSSFESQWGLHSRDPQGYSKLRDGS